MSAGFLLKGKIYACITKSLSGGLTTIMLPAGSKGLGLGVRTSGPLLLCSCSLPIAIELGSQLSGSGLVPSVSMVLVTAHPPAAEFIGSSPLPTSASAFGRTSFPNSGIAEPSFSDIARLRSGCPSFPSLFAASALTIGSR